MQGFSRHQPHIVCRGIAILVERNAATRAAAEPHRTNRLRTRKASCSSRNRTESSRSQTDVASDTTPNRRSFIIPIVSKARDLHFFSAVLADSRNAFAVGAPLLPGLRIFSPLPALMRSRLAWMFA